MLRASRLLWVVLVVLAISVGPSCAQEDEGAQVRVLSFPGPTTPAVYLYVDGMGLAGDGHLLAEGAEDDFAVFATHTLSPYFTLPAGTHTFAFARGLARGFEGADEASFVEQVMLEAGHRYTVIVFTPPAGTPRDVVVVDETAAVAGVDPETVAVQIVAHTMTDGPSLMLRLDDVVQFENLAYGETATWMLDPTVAGENIQFAASDDPDTVILTIRGEFVNTMPPGVYLWFFLGPNPQVLYIGDVSIVDGGPVTAGEALTLALNWGERARYTLALDEAVDTAILLSAAAAGPFDSYLRLYDEAGNLLAENDDASGTNARLRLELAAGTYLIEAGTFLDSYPGEYELLVRAVE
ncbi:MAG: DUF4397 domain-containing protein [Anaerolineae bacterium]|nr:DUF4397 domain-containing protein [Anaerolineae bacterium]